MSGQLWTTASLNLHLFSPPPPTSHSPTSLPRVIKNAASMPLIIVFGHWLAVYFMNWCDNYWTDVWSLNYFLFLLFSYSHREIITCLIYLSEETKHLFFCLFSRLMRKQADQSGATREEIKSDRVKENKVCLPVF